MAIQYVRTMKINYGTKMQDIEFAKLSSALADKGVFLNDGYSKIDESKYGFINVEDKTQVFGITINDETQFTVDWESDAQIIVNGLKNLHPDVNYNSVLTTINTKEWAKPEGHALTFNISLDGDIMNFEDWGSKHTKYESGVKMYSYIENDYEGLRLRFRVVWDCEKIQRKEIIEDVMVQELLNDMGKIQKIVEGRLKLKKFGYDVDDVSIDCHFDAKTESRSECTPDIIKQVREARRGN